ncbi:hypothetical protein F4561_001444 [Lipingzhangella halophila]|uniref:Uncharacterized protein n=1 Tax=Lipingzhangella halophila TaxID=1783352 RepID=A0A7W7REW4_9ACTN|nr:hypothetical protein [Lipingzhangella halophila]
MPSAGALALGPQLGVAAVRGQQLLVPAALDRRAPIADVGAAEAYRAAVHVPEARHERE